MRYLQTPLLILLLVLFNSVTAGQEDTAGDLKLVINHRIDEPANCSADEARAFYQTLDDFQSFLDELALMDDLWDMEESWFHDYGLWLKEHWASLNENLCAGRTQLMDMLRAQLKYTVLEAGMGEISDVPAEGAMAYARALANTDLKLIDSGYASESELELNRMVADLPRCSAEQALEFYATIDGFTRLTSALGSTGNLWNVGSDELEQALISWAQSFDSWRQEAWSGYYDQPCGVTRILVYNLEARTYFAVLMRAAGLDPSNMLTRLIQNWLAMAEYDRSAINSIPGE